MSELRAVLSDALATEIERLVDERVAAALATRVLDAGHSPWLSIEGAANYLKVSPRTLGRLLADGRIPTATVGRRRLVHRNDLDAHMKANRR